MCFFVDNRSGEGEEEEVVGEEKNQKTRDWCLY